MIFFHFGKWHTFSRRQTSGWQSIIIPYCLSCVLLGQITSWRHQRLVLLPQVITFKRHIFQSHWKILYIVQKLNVFALLLDVKLSKHFFALRNQFQENPAPEIWGTGKIWTHAMRCKKSTLTITSELFRAWAAKEQLTDTMRRMSAQLMDMAVI